MNTGRIVQVVGPVIDIEFPPKSMPAILNAIHIDGTTDDGKVKIHLTAEVMQHIGYNVVRAVAMSSTDGLVRGMEAVDTGAPISVRGPGTPRERNRHRADAQTAIRATGHHESLRGQRKPEEARGGCHLLF